MDNYRNFGEPTHKNEEVEKEEFERIMVDLFVDYGEALKNLADR